MNNNGYAYYKVVVVGAGGVGFWLTVALARDVRDVAIEVWDDDTFEGGNGHRRLPVVGSPSTPKVEFLKGFLEMVMEDGENVTPVNAQWGPVVGPGQAEALRDVLVVDCTDMDLNRRREMWDIARAQGATMWRVSYDGNGVVVCAPGLPLGGRKGGGYSQVPSLAQSFRAGGTGAEVVEKLLRGELVEEFQLAI